MDGWDFEEFLVASASTVAPLRHRDVVARPRFEHGLIAFEGIADVDEADDFVLRIEPEMGFHTIRGYGPASTPLRGQTLVMSSEQQVLNSGSASLHILHGVNALVIGVLACDDDNHGSP